MKGLPCFISGGSLPPSVLATFRPLLSFEHAKLAPYLTSLYMLFLLPGILILNFLMAHSLTSFISPSQIPSLVSLFLTVLLKIGAILTFFSFSLLYFLLSMYIFNIILCFCLYNYLSPTRGLAPWELGFCLFHCCFLRNQNNAHCKHLWSELVLEHEVYVPGGREMICIIYQNIFPDGFLLPFLFCIIKRPTQHKRKKFPLYKHQSYSANSMLKKSVSPNSLLNSLVSY